MLLMLMMPIFRRYADAAAAFRRHAAFAPFFLRRFLRRRCHAAAIFAAP